MEADNGAIAGFGTAVGRWAGLGPYYAMFPLNFAFSTVSQLCPVGGSVLDPFAGRGSSIFAAAAQSRSGLGIEINPVGWLYGTVKLSPAPKHSVVSRVLQIDQLAATISGTAIDQLPEFFRICYCTNVLRFLLAARSSLQWRACRTDSTLMAILLVYLHGKRSQSLSNQLRQGKAMSPEYCIRWWNDRDCHPPQLDPVAFLLQRIDWRYAHGSVASSESEFVHGDSTQVLSDIANSVKEGRRRPFDLLFTSPPYFSVTNYNYDQWLRLWMLGGEDHPVRSRGRWQSKFDSKSAYRELVETVFKESANALSPEAAVLVRTDAREFTLDATKQALTTAFPEKRIHEVAQPYRKRTQTALFGDQSQKPGEIDILLQ